VNRWFKASCCSPRYLYISILLHLSTIYQLQLALVLLVIFSSTTVSPTCLSPLLSCSAPLIAFKNLPSGDVGTNSWSLKTDKEKDTKANMVTTGTYTFYRDEQALIVGTQIDPVPLVTAAASVAELPSKLQECLNRCDEMVDCAGITIRMNVLEVNRPTTCKLIKGERKLGVFKRTVVRSVGLTRTLQQLLIPPWQHCQLP